MDVLYVHGGVSGTAKGDLPSMDHAFHAAADATSALDAVELAICSLEDDPSLNAGYGAVLCLDGRLELDAGISVGPAVRIGGVANVTVRHPITLARRVMDGTPHALIAGTGAQELGADLEQLTDTTPERRRQWEEAVRAGILDGTHYGMPEHVDTVGGIAVDAAGNLAAGSSTGGVFGKLPGRVGDAPVFGAGFCTSARAAIVGTGVGETFLQTLACMRVATFIDDGKDPQVACRSVIEEIAREGAIAGLLAVDIDGRVGAAYHGAWWPVADREGPIDAERVS